MTLSRKVLLVSIESGCMVSRGIHSETVPLTMMYIKLKMKMLQKSSYK